MSTHQCVAAPQTSIRRCRNKAKHGLYCGVHGKLNKKGTTSIRHYDGSVVRYENGDIHNPRTVVKTISYWVELNKLYGKKKKISEEVKKITRIVRAGTVGQVTEAFVSEKFFLSDEAVCQFFTGRGDTTHFYGEVLVKARAFLGVCLTLKRRADIITRLQAIARGTLSRRETGVTPELIKIRVRYNKHTKKITKIQRWWRHWNWLKNLPVSPKEMVKRYIPNTHKIVFLQNFMSYYIKRKIHRSHGCPYSGENYWDIPKEDRMVYCYKAGNATHWRYYDIQWLHEDFLHQTRDKRFVVEPTTKEELPEEFVVEVARAAWRRTRLDNCYLHKEEIEAKEVKEAKEAKEGEEKAEIMYNRYRDWDSQFARRSLYCFSLMLFDIADKFDIPIDEVDPLAWRSPDMRKKFQWFYLENSNILFQMARSSGMFDLENDIFYRTGEILSMPMVLVEEDNMDILSGEAVFGAHIFMLRSKNMNEDARDVFLSIIKNGFKEMFP